MDQNVRMKRVSTRDIMNDSSLLNLFSDEFKKRNIDVNLNDEKSISKAITALLEKTMGWGLPFIRPLIIENKTFDQHLENYFEKNHDTFYVEVTRKCNFNCMMCFDHSQINKESKNISLNDFEKIIEKHNIRFIKFSGLGEPFLNKDFYEILKLCSKRNIRTLVTTNFSLVSFNKHEQELSKIDLLCVSLHASSRETHENITKSKTFERIVDNIKIFRNINKTKDITIKMVVCSLNEHEIDSFYELADKLGVYPILTGIDLSYQEIVDSHEDQEFLLPKTDQAREYVRCASSSCKQPNWPMISCDGSVFVCCKMPPFGYIGNASDILDFSLLTVAKQRALKECRRCMIS